MSNSARFYCDTYVETRLQLSPPAPGGRLTPGGTNGAERSIARRLLRLIDLTSLREDNNAVSVGALAALAATEAGRVAAFCTWPRFIPVARQTIGGTGIAIAAVANFPAGGNDIDAAAAETAATIAAGANEVDVVFPFRAFLDGDTVIGQSLVRACREACGNRAILKVILETGQLDRPELIERAAELAIDGGARFLKTSTGKRQPGATPQAVQVLLKVIEAARKRSMTVGLKVSGGVSTIAQAQSYLELYEQTFGTGSATAENFRIGTSALITPVLAALQ
jgi:deoxyribose-phosphate aldolase